MTSQMRQVAEVAKALADNGINNMRDVQALIRLKQERDGIPAQALEDLGETPVEAPASSKARVGYINANASMKELQQSLTMIVSKLYQNTTFCEIAFMGEKPSMMDVRRYLEKLAQVDFYQYDSESPLLREPCLRQIEKGLRLWEDYNISPRVRYEVVYDTKVKN